MLKKNRFGKNEDKKLYIYIINYKTNIYELNKYLMY